MAARESGLLFDAFTVLTAMTIIGANLLAAVLLLSSRWVWAMAGIILLTHLCTAGLFYWHSRRFGDDVVTCTAAALMLGPIAIPLLFAHTGSQLSYRRRAKLYAFADEHRN